MEEEQGETIQAGKRRSSLGALSKSKPVSKFRSMFESKVDCASPDQTPRRKDAAGVTSPAVLQVQSAAEEPVAGADPSGEPMMSAMDVQEGPMASLAASPTLTHVSSGSPYANDASVGADVEALLAPFQAGAVSSDAVRGSLNFPSLAAQDFSPGPVSGPAPLPYHGAPFVASTNTVLTSCTAEEVPTYTDATTPGAAFMTVTVSAASCMDVDMCEAAALAQYQGTEEDVRTVPDEASTDNTAPRTDKVITVATVPEGGALPSPRQDDASGLGSAGMEVDSAPAVDNCIQPQGCMPSEPPRTLSVTAGPGADNSQLQDRQDDGMEWDGEAPANGVPSASASTSEYASIIHKEAAEAASPACSDQPLASLLAAADQAAVQELTESTLAGSADVHEADTVDVLHSHVSLEELTNDSSIASALEVAHQATLPVLPVAECIEKLDSPALCRQAPAQQADGPVDAQLDFSSSPERAPSTVPELTATTDSCAEGISVEFGLVEPSFSSKGPAMGVIVAAEAVVAESSVAESVSFPSAAPQEKDAAVAVAGVVEEAARAKESMAAVRHDADVDMEDASELLCPSADAPVADLNAAGEPSVEAEVTLDNEQSTAPSLQAPMTAVSASLAQSDPAAGGEANVVAHKDAAGEVESEPMVSMAAPDVCLGPCDCETLEAASVLSPANSAKLSQGAIDAAAPERVPEAVGPVATPAACQQSSQQVAETLALKPAPMAEAVEAVEAVEAPKVAGPAVDQLPSQQVPEVSAPETEPTPEAMEEETIAAAEQLISQRVAEVSPPEPMPEALEDMVPGPAVEQLPSQQIAEPELVPEAMEAEAIAAAGQLLSQQVAEVSPLESEPMPEALKEAEPEEAIPSAGQPSSQQVAEVSPPEAKPMPAAMEEETAPAAGQLLLQQATEASPPEVEPLAEAMEEAIVVPGQLLSQQVAEPMPVDEENIADPEVAGQAASQLPSQQVAEVSAPEPEAMAEAEEAIPAVGELPSQQVAEVSTPGLKPKPEAAQVACSATSQPGLQQEAAAMDVDMPDMVGVPTVAAETPKAEGPELSCIASPGVSNRSETVAPDAGLGTPATTAARELAAPDVMAIEAELPAASLPQPTSECVGSISPRHYAVAENSPAADEGRHETFPGTAADACAVAEVAAGVSSVEAMLVVPQTYEQHKTAVPDDPMMVSPLPAARLSLRPPPAARPVTEAAAEFVSPETASAGPRAFMLSGLDEMPSEPLPVETEAAGAPGGNSMQDTVMEEDEFALAADAAAAVEALTIKSRNEVVSSGPIATEAPPALDTLEAWGDDDLLMDGTADDTFGSLPPPMQVVSSPVSASKSQDAGSAARKAPTEATLQSLDLFSLHASCGRVSDSLMAESLDTFESNGLCAKSRAMPFIPLAPLREAAEQEAEGSSLMGAARRASLVPPPASQGGSPVLGVAVNGMATSPSPLWSAPAETATPSPMQQSPTPLTGGKPGAGTAARTGQAKITGAGPKGVTTAVSRPVVTPSSALKALAAGSSTAGSSGPKTGVPKRTTPASTAAQPKSALAPGQTPTRPQISGGDFDLDTVDISAEASKALAMLGGSDGGDVALVPPSAPAQQSTPVLVAPARGAPAAPENTASTPSTQAVVDMHINMLTSKLAEEMARNQKIQDENVMLRDQLSTLQFEQSMTGDLDMEREARHFLEQELAGVRQRCEALEAETRKLHADIKRRDQASEEQQTMHKAREEELLAENQANAEAMQRMKADLEAFRTFVQEAQERISHAETQASAAVSKAEAQAAAAIAKCNEETAQCQELSSTLARQTIEVHQLRRGREEAEAKFQKAMEQLIVAQTAHKKQVNEYESRLHQQNAIVSQFNELREKYRQMKEACAQLDQRAKHAESKAQEKANALQTCEAEKSELLRMCSDLLTQLEAAKRV
ncbi:hypothetical protein GPECTOR_5g215 [Gonium pectorale]|uniref:Uncharacterized protein n=1 Tax=Gonium pectorale TaxID=33097 RepID=A0A150GWG7_GONPE|nr:hypothetical protein GPECTOR_5g215 [Gonium pectorale]|eukprot:KXZ54113.1 hypothetical protein GPECTOR_5g215 [Gonium pectorale]